MRSPSNPAIVGGVSNPSIPFVNSKTNTHISPDAPHQSVDAIVNNRFLFYVERTTYREKTRRKNLQELTRISLIRCGHKGAFDGNPQHRRVLTYNF